MSLFDFFKPVWMSQDYKKENAARAAVGKITDQSTLAGIVKNAPHNTVRYTALHRITDQNLLAMIATSDKDEKVREIAARKIENHKRDAPLEKYLQYSQQELVQIRKSATGDEKNHVDRVIWKKSIDTCKTIITR